MTATAQRRIRTSVTEEEAPARPLLPQVAGPGPRSAEVHDTAVLVEQWRELITQAPAWAPGRCDPPPLEAVGRLIAELLDRAPHSTAAQLRAGVPVPPRPGTARSRVPRGSPSPHRAGNRGGSAARTGEPCARHVGTPPARPIPPHGEIDLDGSGLSG